MSGKVLSYNLSEPLNGATTAKVDINAGTGNMSVDTNTNGEQVLATGELEYIEKQGVPAQSVNVSNGQAAFTVKASGPGKVGFHFPWQACNGETNWQIHLNPSLKSDVAAQSDGGNIKLDLTGMALSSLYAGTGGGNIALVLPDVTENLSVTAKSGAGNVTARVPSGIAARIFASTGWGKVVMDPQFSKIDKNTYQSANYDAAPVKAEITLTSGAGNVIVSTN